MREIHVADIIEAVADLAEKANFFLGEDVIERIEELRKREDSPVARNVIDIMLANCQNAAEQRIPMCQDTGTSVVFMEIGQDVRIVGGDLRQAINDGIAKGYTDGYLRKSIIEDPIYNRKNTGDNTPAVIHFDITAGENIRITFAPKGGGAENMSRLTMLTPNSGEKEIEEFILDTVRKAGPNACPPIVVGVGVGGNFEMCAVLAKKSLMRNLKDKNPDSKLADFEERLLDKINKLGIGPQGFGGRTTALAVNILSAPCHITGLPLAVNIQCHASRHKSVIL